MKFDFLRDFSKRMKNVGRYAILMNNTFLKGTWKQYDIQTIDEQINILYSVLLFIMESSLKEENCTMDNIADFLGQICNMDFGKNYSLEEVENLAEFIVNTIFCNAGNTMSFMGYDYEHRAYKEYTIRFLKNEVVYIENNIRRTSYSLTEEGYNMVLASLEIENNMRISVHEMLFKMHLEKADYGSAEQDMKKIFDELRIQYQKIQDAMNRIRKNALSYSVEEYDALVHENIDTLEDSRKKFHVHKENVEKRVMEFEQHSLKDGEFNDKDKESIKHLREIDKYLQRALDEQQRIMGEHFDLKSLYDKELENYVSMTMVQRFSFDSEIYERVLSNSELLDKVDQMLTPLFYSTPKKIYNPNLAMEYQKKLVKLNEDEEMLELDFDEEEYQKELEEKKRQKHLKYKNSVEIFIDSIYINRNINIRKMKEDEYKIYGDKLIPDLETFREIVIEFLSAETIDIEEMQRERKEFFMEESFDFKLNKLILEIIEDKNITNIKHLYCEKLDEEDMVVFDKIMDEHGQKRKLKCSNIRFWCD